MNCVMKLDIWVILHKVLKFLKRKIIGCKAIFRASRIFRLPPALGGSRILRLPPALVRSRILWIPLALIGNWISMTFHAKCHL